jgi:hypothetical protein
LVREKTNKSFVRQENHAHARNREKKPFVRTHARDQPALVVPKKTWIDQHRMLRTSKKTIIRALSV